jgi:hypothetical protein
MVGNDDPFTWDDTTAADTASPAQAIDGGDPGDAATQDAAPAKTDGGAPAAPKLWGCNSYGLCSGKCVGAALTGSAFDSCKMSCDANASLAALQQLNQTYTCGLDACVALGYCLARNDLTAQCGNCASNVVASAFGLTCLPGLPCNLAACQQAALACTSQLP